MAYSDEKIITLNWRVIGRTLILIIKFIKWPVTFIGATYLLAIMSDQLHELHPNWELVLRYVDIVRWPLVVLWVLWFIKPNLPDLLDRLEELNIFGNNAKFSNLQKQKRQTQAEDLQQIDPAASNPNTKKADDIQITDDHTHASLTSYSAAAAYTEIYTDIFGTQIHTLLMLLDYPDGLKGDQLSDVIEEHNRRSNGKGYKSIASFMQYLLRNTLVLYDNQTQTYQLTVAGFYFLAFLKKAELLERSKNW